MSKMTIRGITLSMAALALGAGGCGEEMEGADDATEASEIIGGNAITVATRRSLGLIDVPGCSGALFTPDWVVTAAHCVDFANPSNMVFSAPRTDGGSDQRLGSYVVQLGSADMAMVRLQAAAAGNQWPSVSHPVSTGLEQAFVGQSITCYGRGNTAYQADGTGVTGFGTWKSLTKQLGTILTLPLDGNGYRATAVGSPGSEIYSFGDSGSNCYDNSGSTRLMGVETAGQCASWSTQGQPMDPGCNTATVTSHANSLIRVTIPFRNYMTEAPNRAATTFQPITAFLNSWVPANVGTFPYRPSFTKTSGYISLRGLMRGGTTFGAFNLPAGFRPSARVYVPIVTNGATIGRVVVQTNGDLTVESEGGGLTADATAFSALDGVSFAENATGTTAMTLVNGWVAAPFSTRVPAARVVDGFVRFQGAMVNGTNAIAFTLPAAMRPANAVWLRVGLCNGAKGRLNITTGGQVSVQAENGNFAAATCFTSLEGASFAVSTGSREAALQNGWVHNAFQSGNVRYRNDGGIVRFQGAASSGTDRKLFTLDAAFRPAGSVWLYVDTFGGKRGRIKIESDGDVLVDPASQLTDAAGFLSFEGAAFGL